MKKYIILLIGLLAGFSSFAIGDSTLVTSLTSSLGFITNQPDFSVTINFAEDVNDIDLNKIQIINGYANNLRIASTYRRNWTFTVWANKSQERVGIIAPAGMISNYPANDTWNKASDTLWVYVDYTRPSIHLSSNSPNPTNQNYISVDISSSEYLSGFAQNDIYLENATLDTFLIIQPNHKWKANLKVIQDGLVNAYISENRALDTAQNGNFRTDTLSRRFDTTPPHVALSTTNDSLSNKSKITINVDFDEQITGFDSTDFKLFNSKLDTLYESGTDSSHFIAGITPLSDGIFWISLVPNAVTDLLNNYNTAADTLFFSYDGTPPEAALSTSSISPTAKDTLYYMLHFSEPVNNLTSAGIYLSAGNLLSLRNEIPNIEWSFKILNTSSRTIDVYFKKDQVTDLAGNKNLQSDTIRIETDHSSPSCTLFTYEANPTNKDSILVYAHFDEPVYGFTISDLSVNGGTINHFTTDSTTDFNFYAFPQTGDSLMFLSVLDSSYFDVFNHPGSSSNFLDIQYDIDSPQVTVTSVQGDVVHDVFTIHFTFNEFVSHFIADSIHITNGSASSIYESKTGYEWSATISPTVKGNVSFSLGSEAATDRAGNKSQKSNTATVWYNDDIYPPTPILTTEIPKQTNKTVIPLIITFDEEVINFTISDISLTNASVAKFQQITANKSWLVNIVPLNDGWVSAEIKSHVCSDISKNDNLQSNQLVWKVDMTVPTLKVATSQTSPTKVTHIPIKFSFSEQVDSFDITDIKTQNSFISGFVTVVQDKIWSANLVPDSSFADSDVNLKVFVPSGIAFDVAHNPNDASDTITLEYDGLSPSLTIENLLKNDTTYYDTATVIINFSEDVFGNILEKTSLTNCTVDNFSISVPNRQYRIRLKAKEEGIFGLRVSYGAVYDKVGNLNQPVEMALYYTIQNNSSAINSLKKVGINAFAFKNELHIHYFKSLINADRLRIFDLNGKSVFQKKLFGKQEFVFVLPLKTGLYFLQIEQNKHFYRQKIIIKN